MRSIATIILIGGIGLTAAVGAQQAPRGAPKLEAGHEAAVAGRQAAFLMSAAHMGAMKAGIARGDDPKAYAFAARSVARWAKALPGMFPPGSATPSSEALPAVWSDRKGFEAKAAAYAAAADTLAKAAAAGDAAAFAAAHGEVGKTCQSCHDAYRKPQPPR